MRTIYQFQIYSHDPKRWGDTDEAGYKRAIVNGCNVRRVQLMSNHSITVREWWSRNHGPEWVARIHDVTTGDVVVKRSGGSGGWEVSVANALEALGYPAREGGSPTVYFREVCNVPYDYREVQRKKDL